MNWRGKETENRRKKNALNTRDEDISERGGLHRIQKSRAVGAETEGGFPDDVFSHWIE